MSAFNRRGKTVLQHRRKVRSCLQSPPKGEEEYPLLGHPYPGASLNPNLDVLVNREKIWGFREKGINHSNVPNREGIGTSGEPLA